VKPEEEQSRLRAARYIAIATQLPATVVAGYFLGYALDYWLGTTWLRLLFLIVAVIGAMAQLIRQVLKDQKSK
jgi:F0F1-type ATP synthase assembly protein I